MVALAAVSVPVVGAPVVAGSPVIVPPIEPWVVPSPVVGGLSVAPTVVTVTVEVGATVVRLVFVSPVVVGLAPSSPQANGVTSSRVIGRRA